MVTDAQVRLLRQKRMEGKTQETAAAAAGMSVRSARKWQSGPLPSQAERVRTWRTRKDPFAKVWESIVVPILLADKDGVLEATTILDRLQREDSKRFGPGQLRTLQRRVREWRALNGPPREVYFAQEHPPGREAAVDFTHAGALGVTIAGEPFEHLLFELVLSMSGWTHCEIARGETFEALVAGLQRGLWKLGGVPRFVRSDNLSAATHELRRSAGRKLTDRFKAVLDHYAIRSTRITPGRSHENGVVEQRHRRTKSLLAQELVLRGSRDFETAEAYQAFIDDVIERRINAALADKLAAERAALRPLPSSPVPEYTTYHPMVRRWSTIRVRGRVYSVPSQLMGHTVEARLHPDRLEVRYLGHLVLVTERLRGDRTSRIDYRHVIHSLVRKPGAFARYRYRDELFPTPVFRRAYDRLEQLHGSRADVEYVRVLKLAATTMQAVVEKALVRLLAEGRPLDYALIETRARTTPPHRPRIRIAEPDLAGYDELLSAGGVR